MNNVLTSRVEPSPPRVTPVNPPAAFLWGELWRDKSVQRAGMNWLLRESQEDLKGVVVDLGCGPDPSGVGRISRGNGARYLGLDIDFECRPTIMANLNEPLPLASNIADAVVIAHCFYIVARPHRLLEEAHRVLKPRGSIFLVAPLIWQYYPEPKDYWRFTAEAVEMLLREAGFDGISIFSVGGRWTSSAHLISPFLHPGRILRPLVHLSAVALDRLFSKIMPRVGPVPLIYCAKARST
jgi:SAM-dependent methyltransferase